MVARAHGDAFLIQYRPNIVRMNLVQHKRQHACLFPRSANQADSRQRAHNFRRILQQIVLVRGNLSDADSVHVPDRRLQPSHASHIRRARFEFVREFVINCLLECHRADHVPAALVRRHGLQQRGLAVKGSDAGRCKDLVA